MAAEQQVLDRLERQVPDGYEFRANVRVGAPDSPRRLLLDGLYRSRTGTTPDVIVEVRISSAVKLALSARLNADQLLALVVRYEDAVGRKGARGWLIVVAPDDRSDEDLTREQKRLEAELAPRGAATVVRRGEIDRLQTSVIY